jgi:hypothetical protein
VKAETFGRCKNCGQHYRKFQTFQKWCSIDCATQIALKALERAKKKRLVEVSREKKNRLERLKTRSELILEVQREFNRYIRIRDSLLPCISCGVAATHQAAKWQAGHYLSTGARPDLRFDEFNVHKQCVRCNMHLAGNITLYRIGLAKKIGADQLSRLEGTPDPLTVKMSREELSNLRVKYRKMANEMLKNVERTGQLAVQDGSGKAS